MSRLEYGDMDAYFWERMGGRCYVCVCFFCMSLRLDTRAHMMVTIFRVSERSLGTSRECFFFCQL